MTTNSIIDNNPSMSTLQGLKAQYRIHRIYGDNGGVVGHVRQKAHTLPLPYTAYAYTPTGTVVSHHATLHQAQRKIGRLT